MLSEFFLVGMGIVAIAFLFILPRSQWKVVLFSQGCACAFIWTSTPWLATVLWILAPLPLFGRQWRFNLLQSLSGLLFSLGIFVSSARPYLGASLIAFASWVRAGLFPFQSGYLRFSESGEFLRLIPLLSSQMGVFALLRWALPLGLLDIAAARTTLSVLSIGGALYFSFLALGSLNPRRMVILLSLAATSLGLVQLSASNTALTLQFFHVGLFTAGLGLTAFLIQTRFGDYLGGGLAATTPLIASFFLLFALAAAAFPGSTGFVSTELILGSLFSDRPLSGILYLISLALSFLAVYVCYVENFLGTPHFRMVNMDLVWRERIGLFVLVAALVIPFFAAGALGSWMERGTSLIRSDLTNRVYQGNVGTLR